MVTSTLEWLADHSVDSGVYTVTAATKDKSMTSCYNVVFALNEELRGDPQESAKEIYEGYPDSPNYSRVVEVGDEFLICFRHYSNGDKRAVHLINLSKPRGTGVNHLAVTRDIRILKDGKKILEVFRKRLKDHPNGAPVEVGDHSKDNRFELPAQTKLYNAIYSGSSCYLRMPSDFRPHQLPTVDLALVANSRPGHPKSELVRYAILLLVGLIFVCVIVLLVRKVFRSNHAT